jgi:hypothetical protein
MVDIHSMVSHLMLLSSAQAVVGFHGVVAVAGFSVAGEGSVVGDNKKIVAAWGPSMEPNPLIPFNGCIKQTRREQFPAYRQAWVVLLALCSVRYAIL